MVVGGAALAGHGATVAGGILVRELTSGWQGILTLAKAKTYPAPNPALGYYGTNEQNTGDNAISLRKNMGLVATPGQAAHHIVPSTNKYASAIDARNILQRFGIDINAKVNGVLVPVSYNSQLNTPRYMNAVLNKLSPATSKAQVEEILGTISQEISNHTFPF